MKLRPYGTATSSTFTSIIFHRLIAHNSIERRGPARSIYCSLFESRLLRCSPFRQRFLFWLLTPVNFVSYYGLQQVHSGKMERSKLNDTNKCRQQIIVLPGCFLSTPFKFLFGFCRQQISRNFVFCMMGDISWEFKQNNFHVSISLIIVLRRRTNYWGNANNLNLNHPIFI